MLGKHPFLNLSDFLDNRQRWIRWVMECCSPILQMGVRCPHRRLRRKKWARWTRDMKIWPQCPTPSLKVCYEFIWSLLYLTLLIKVSFHMVFHFKLLIKVRFSCIIFYPSIKQDDDKINYLMWNAVIFFFHLLFTYIIKEM